MIIPAPGNDFPALFLNSCILTTAVQKLCPQTGSPYLLWLCTRLEFPPGLFAGLGASLLCQCQRNKKLGASPEVLIVQFKLKTGKKFKMKKASFRSSSAAIKAVDYVNGLASFP